jgi:hypothetical protein
MSRSRRRKPAGSRRRLQKDFPLKHLMTTPPPSSRPLQLAIRSASLLGLCSGLFGFVFVFVFGYFNRYERYRLHFIGLGLIVWLVPGVLLFTNAMMMRQGRRRGAVGAIAVASAQGLFALMAFAANFMLSPISVIPVLLTLLWFAAIVQLLLHLRLSLPLLQRDIERRTGFEVTAPRKVLPVEEE